jgi:hypothetical protein
LSRRIAMSESGVSQTVKNLEAAFAGESMANRRYLYFSRLCHVRVADDLPVVSPPAGEGEWVIQQGEGGVRALFKGATVYCAALPLPARG